MFTYWEVKKLECGSACLRTNQRSLLGRKPAHRNSCLLVDNVTLLRCAYIDQSEILHGKGVTQFYYHSILTKTREGERERERERERETD